MTDDEIRQLHPLDSRRIQWATEQRQRRFPHWGKTNEELMIDKLREEIAAQPRKRKRGPNIGTVIKGVVKHNATAKIGDMVISANAGDADPNPIDITMGLKQ